MAEIFLSYRRQDSQSATGRLADVLEAHFGDDRVFRDREIVAGEDFVAAIRRSVHSAAVLLVVVGRHWLDARDADGRRRLDDPADFVRLEIELALAAGIAIVPVLIEGATMPAADDLPPSLAEFSRCQAVELSDTRWRYDTEQLIATLHSRFAIEPGIAPRSSSEPRTTLVLTRSAGDLVDLAVHPTRLIARRHTGRAGDPARAFGFLAAAILAGNVILLFGFDIGEGTGTSWAEGLATKASWVLTGELVGLLAALVLAAPLAWAWRIVARAAAFRRVGLVAAYVYGGVWIGLCTGAIVAGTGVQLVDSTFFARVLQVAHATAMAPDSPAAVMPELRWQPGAPFGGAAAVLLLLALAIWAATSLWCIAAWGAFRQAFGATRLQAWAATSLWLAMICAVLWFGQNLV